ncbi:hypothetical protein MTO96_019031 [Rhipicephalus appendiculatus]
MEFAWRNVLVALLKRRPTALARQNVHLIGEVHVPDEASWSTLSFGPKYCNRPKLDKTGMLALVLNPARRASTEQESDSEGKEHRRPRPSREEAIHAPPEDHRRAATNNGTTLLSGVDCAKTNTRRQDNGPAAYAIVLFRRPLLCFAQCVTRRTVSSGVTS